MYFRIFTILFIFCGLHTTHAYNNASKLNNKPIISEVLYDGHFIILNDQSIWEIAPEDRPISSAWITPTTILISSSQDERYPYILKNELTQSSIKANKISHKNLEEKIKQIKTDQSQTNYKLSPKKEKG